MKIGVVLVIAVFFVCALASTGFTAGEKKSFKEASKDAARATVDYPANVVNETTKVVGKAAKGTADTVVNTAKATGETFTKDPKKAPDIVVAPVKGSAETVRDATVGVVETPVVAGKKTAEQM